MPSALVPVALAFCTLLVAGTLRGITGFGLLLVATPLLFQLFDPKLVIAALIVPGLLTNVTILARDGVPWAELDAHRALYLAGVGGVLVGVAGLVVLDRRAIFLLVAAYIGAFLVLQHRGDLARDFAARRGLSVLAGGSGGVLGGTVGLSGPPIVTYLHAKRLDKRVFVGLLAVYFLVVSVARIPSMYAVGLFGPAELGLGVAFTVPAVVGTYLGTVVRPRVPQALFERGVEAFLLVVAAKLVLDGLAVQLW